MLNSIKLKSYISPYLLKIDKDISSIISEGFINQIAQNVAFGGKRTRPTILILISNLLGGKHEDKFLNAATGVELIHLASLLHDDVIDENNKRHDKSTAHILFGNQQTILGGDFLFAESFKKIAKTKDLEVIDAISNASSVLASGELMQLQRKAEEALKIEDYYEIIYKKTASLFEASTRIASIIQGGIGKSEASSFGKNIGMAFQVIDDLLDYTSNETNKKQGADFYENKITLPVILAISKLNSGEKKKLLEYFKKDEKTVTDFLFIKSKIQEVGAFEECKEIAKTFCEAAKKDIIEIEKLLGGKPKESEMIFSLIEFFSNRVF